MKYTREFKQEVYELVRDMPRRLRVQAVKEHLKKDLTMNQIDQFMTIVKNNTDLEDLNDIDIGDNPYEFDEEDIVFYRNIKNREGDKVKERIAIDIYLIKQLSESYTRLGKNRSIAKLKREFGIKEDVLRLIFRRLGIYKDSNIVPDCVLDRIQELGGDTAVEQAIVEGTHKAIDSKYTDRFVDKYEKIYKRKLEKSMEILAKTDNFLGHLKTYLVDYKPQKIEFKYDKLPTDRSATYVISDLHLGKAGTQQIVERINAITVEAIEDDADHIDLLCLGDLGESFAPEGMHSGQERHMEITGFALYMFIVEVLTEMIKEIAKHKSIHFHGITGNHDRIAKGHDQDHERTAGLVIYEIVRSRLPEENVKYYPDKWNILELDGIGYVIHHGDGGFNSKKTGDILREYRPKTDHVIVMSGDWHHLEFKNESNGILRVLAPALAGKGEYDTRIGLSSYSGYLIIRKNKFGIPEILPKFLP